ncbi:L,D-transpeptidase family protein [uncultured Phycicoccus sp.]|uniref:L,D-transpeptidase family protein n=1 Tax=uncultured Phycicoccus sp. TaxID=661422 RepID=UPI002618A1D5|nr:L,D-transpeptidase family protein [uncultured Phycicoccus sp.]
MKTRSVLLTAAVTVPMLLGGVGTAYAAHFQDHALPGSSVAGVSVAGMTRDEVTASVRQRAADLRVDVRTGDTSRSQRLTDLGYTVDVDATVDAIFAANSRWSSYATSLVSSRDVDAVVSSDPVAVDAVTAALVEDAGKVGRNATVALTSKKTSFEVTPAVAGHTVDPASLQDVVAAAARDLTPATATVRFVETDPAVTTAAAERIAAAANSIVQRSVTVSDGAEKHTASAKAKASWVTIPTADGAAGAPTVDRVKVRTWVDGLAASLKTEPVAGLRNVSAAGAVLSVVTQAHDGRTVSNAPAVAKAAVAALTDGKKYSGTFTYDTVPAAWTSRTVAVGAEKLAYPAADGEKWIDVNLSRHTMTAYIGATPVYGPISMVSGAAETPTITGVFRVYTKNPLMTMRGNNADGTRYETPDVPWSAFFHRGFALHGAPWRDSFGYAASHGCINLPVPVAKWVYDFAPMGTPVASHY